jgi:hypothetical protein
VVAGTARPSFDTDSSEHGYSDSDTDQRRRPKENQKTLVDVPSNSDTLGSSDLETDFSAEEEPVVVRVKAPSKPPKPSFKALKPPANPKQPALKLKIKLPPPPEKKKSLAIVGGGGEIKRHKVSKRRRSSVLEGGASQDEKDGRIISKKMRESLALNARARLPTSGSDEEAEERTERAAAAVGPPLLPTKLYCYCQCPHDDVSEMIGCDAPDCLLEWFHFECVGILVPPEGKWFCPQCSQRYGR